MKTFKTLALAAVLAASTVPAAHADTSGYSGHIARVGINETSADDYGTERGYLLLDEGTGTLRKYQWGGQACNGRNLTENSVNVLMRTMGNYALRLVPVFKTGGGGVSCLVGYEVSDQGLILE